jgi:hypothetical protein
MLINDLEHDVTDLVTGSQTNFNSILVFHDQSDNLSVVLSQDNFQWSNPTVAVFGPANTPVVTFFEGQFFLAFLQGNSSSMTSCNLYLTFSTDGINWSLSQLIIAGVPSTKCALFSFNGKLCIVTYYSSGSPDDPAPGLFIADSFDGKVWSELRRVSNDYSANQLTAIAVGGKIYLVIANSQTHQLCLMTFDGSAWSPSTPLFGGTLACNPSISSAYGKLYLSYQPYKNAPVASLCVASYFLNAELNAGRWLTNNPISNRIGGISSSIAITEAGACITYGAINSADLCFISNVTGTNWLDIVITDESNSADPIPLKMNIGGQSICHIPQAFNLNRRLSESVEASVKLPDPHTLNSFLFPGTLDNWNEQHCQDGWGFTGILCIAPTTTKFFNTQPEIGNINPGTILLFPGNQNYDNRSEAEVIKDNPYRGASFLGGIIFPPIVRGPRFILDENGLDVPPLYGQYRTTHAQLCGLLMDVADYDINSDAYRNLLSQYMSNFIGFSYTVATPESNGDKFRTLTTLSGQLNNKYFSSKDGTNDPLNRMSFSSDWLYWLERAVQPLSQIKVSEAPN